MHKLHTCTTKEIALLKIICTIHALVAAPLSYSRFADTLTALRVAFTDISNNTRYIALTLLKYNKKDLIRLSHYHLADCMVKISLLCLPSQP